MSQSWPECVGMSGEEAEARVKESFGGKVHIVPHGSMVTQDKRMDRVRIYLGADGKVEVPPRPG